MKKNKVIKKSEPMYFCERCRAFVPNKDKHNKKRHGEK